MIIVIFVIMVKLFEKSICVNFQVTSRSLGTPITCAESPPLPPTHSSETFGSSKTFWSRRTFLKTISNLVPSFEFLAWIEKLHSELVFFFLHIYRHFVFLYTNRLIQEPLNVKVTHMNKLNALLCNELT